MPVRIQRLTIAVLLAVLGITVLTGCGFSAAATSASSETQLTVFAATSLSEVLPRVARLFTQTHPQCRFTFSFAGTDTLVTQIEHGAPADIFAGASARYGDDLLARKAVAEPRIFVTNRLVLIVPPSNPGHISSLRDLARTGIKLAVGDSTVPIGIYTRKILGQLNVSYGPHYSAAVLRNVVTQALDVGQVVSAVELQGADAGFVYATDALAAGNAVQTVDLPAGAGATALYPIAVVSGTPHADLASEFANFVLQPRAQALFRSAGFGSPPR